MDDAPIGTRDAVAPPPPRRRRRVAGAAAAAIAVLVAIAWSERGDIADRAIGSLLRQQGIAARWRVESIGLGRQVIADVVVGDPANPDLTIDRVETSAGVDGGAPGITAVTLVNPRLRGVRRGGRVSFGSLDRLLNGPSRGPFRLPDIALRVENGQARIAGEGGAIGVGLNGAGDLRDGFGGALVVVARRLDMAGCGIADARFSGRLAVAAERPRLTGPLRWSSAGCPQAGFRSAGAAMPLDLRATAALDGVGGRVGWAVDSPVFGTIRAAALHGGADLAFGGGALTARFTGGLNGARGGGRGGGLTAASLRAEGLLRIRDGGAHLAAEGTIGGTGLAPDAAAARGLDRMRNAAANTPAGPLLARMAQVLAHEAPGSRLSGRFMLHRSGAAASLFLPDLRWTGGSGAPLLAVSRGAVLGDGGAGLHVSGRFATGGGLPAITGAVSRGADGRDRVDLRMAEYRAGTATAAVPRLQLARAGGGLTMAGDALVSGPLPGGLVRNLHLPIAGAWTARGLALWPRCAPIAFDRLAFASLALVGDRLTVCPRPGGAIVQGSAAGIAVAAGVPAFDLAGQLAGSPLRLAGGPLGIGLAPGSPVTLVARSLAVALGQETGGGAGASRFRLDRLDAAVGRSIGGSFSGAEVDLAAVPLNLRRLAGDWRYRDGVFALANATFQVEDRERPARFQPLVAKGAALDLAGGAITAQAVLREPRSDRSIVRVAIRHDLNGGRGHADLAVDPVRFDKGLQPDALSPLMLGIVADVKGSVAGQGTIDWADGKVASRGRFATASLDFAAAFGPVTGLSGEVTFTDLLGLVSAPGQQLRIATINPGVEVDDGVLSYALLPGHVLAIDGATWPFLDGRLRLLPTRLTLGVSEVRRYEMRVEGVDAAKFLTRLNLSNLSATGLFDGGLPLVFDQTGGRVAGGMLTSRPPGGSVSYVGALSYRNLSPIANFAFETLKSLNYRQLTIGLDGSLSGSIFTRVSMRGVSQGPGAKRNVLTRQIAGLPLQFNVNIHAPFYMLMTNFRSLYDSSYVPDPRALGLLGADGRPVAHPRPPASPASGVQPSASGTGP